MDRNPNLNVHQWPLERVGSLQSGNRPGMNVAQEYEAREVHGQHDEHDHEAARKHGYRDAADYQAGLTRHIAEHGIQRPGMWEWGDEKMGEDPNREVLANGYHRYAALRSLGASSMPMKQWTPDEMFNGPAEPVYRWEEPA